MDVRQVRPTDAPLVLSLTLDETAHLIKGSNWPEPNPAMVSVVRSLLPVTSGKTWLAQDDLGVALLEARPRQYVIGWDVTRLVVRGQCDHVLEGVVRAAVRHLQSRGVPRLFARCQQRARDVLSMLEFHALAREFVLVGPEQSVSEDTPLPADTRYRMPQDAWPLHQLEVETTPSLVRQFEGLSSRDWSQRTGDTSEIVVERDGKIVAWIGQRASTRRGVAQLGMVLHPDCGTLGVDLVQYALLTAPKGCRLVARVREYQDDVLRAFTDAGFMVVAEETLMVKHAGVERVQIARGRMRVASVPGIQAMPIRIRGRHKLSSMTLALGSGRED